MALRQSALLVHDFQSTYGGRPAPSGRSRQTCLQIMKDWRGGGGSETMLFFEVDPCVNTEVPRGTTRQKDRRSGRVEKLGNGRKIDSKRGVKRIKIGPTRGEDAQSEVVKEKLEGRVGGLFLQLVAQNIGNSRSCVHIGPSVN